jgi:hypothetical protein
MSSFPAVSPLHPFYDPLALWGGCRATSGGPLQGPEAELRPVAEQEPDDGEPASGPHQQSLAKVTRDLALLTRNANRCA